MAINFTHHHQDATSLQEAKQRLHDKVQFTYRPVRLSGLRGLGKIFFDSITEIVSLERAGMKPTFTVRQMQPQTDGCTSIWHRCASLVGNVGETF